MTASEQHAEYADAHTPTIGAKIRAAIEADVLRRVADRFQREWPVYGDDWLRAEADRIEEGAR